MSYVCQLGEANFFLGTRGGDHRFLWCILLKDRCVYVCVHARTRVCELDYSSSSSNTSSSSRSNISSSNRIIIIIIIIIIDVAVGDGFFK